MTRRNLVYAIIAIIAIAAVGVDVLLGGSGGTAAPGRPAPKLPSEVLVPPAVTTESLRGKPAAINFWASWCEPCRQEAPAFERLSNRLHGRASLVGIDSEDDRASALAFVHRYGWTFPNLRAANGRSYGVFGLPTTFIVDRRGRIAEVLRGPQTARDLERALEAEAGFRG
jgi:thiol-disulfide isomerase/thioredoxin